MLEVFDLQRLKTAILQNSFDRIETEEINAVNKLQFSMPGDDPKTAFCKHFHYVRFDDGQLYRILTPRKSKADISVKIYDCEHVVATLTDDVLFGQHVVGNMGVYTADVINYVLSKQTVQRWVLAECDFNRQFEYAWENENLLAALFSIPNRFTDPYIWKFDTSVFPWRLSLKRIDPTATPQFYIRAGKNLLSMEETQGGTDICTRLYCLGYGEGVNQLTISDVNNGVPYLLAPQSKINEYGLITRIFVDRRFEDAQSLKERGQAILAELQEPKITRTFEVADLYKLTNDNLDNAELGRITRLTEDDTQTYITGITRNHDIPGDMALTLSTKAVDVASTIADLADRQRIEQVYSQGATQIYAQSVQANATETVKAKLNFYIPAEMRIVNAVKVKINLSPFRSYSRATSGGGSTNVTSSSGGGTTVTSSGGGSTTVTSSSGGGTNATSTSGGGTTVTSSSGGGTTVTSAGGGSGTATAASGGGTNATSTSGGGTTVTSSSGGGTTVTSAGGGGTATAASGGGGTATAASGGGTNATSSNGGGTTSTSTYAGAVSASDQLYTGYSTIGSRTINTGSTGRTTGTPLYDRFDSHTHTYVTMPYNADGGSWGYGWHRHLHIIPSHRHSVTIANHSHTVQIPDHTHSVSLPTHTHSVTLPSHTHSVTIAAHTHSITIANHSHTVQIPDHTHSVTLPSHTHSVTIAAHTHSITIAAHTHSISIPSHTHSVTIAEHTHSITIPNHTHNIEQGIFTFGNPTSAGLYINGVYKAAVEADTEMDITQYLLNNQGKINRGAWHSIEVLPNDKAYITIDMVVQGFIQSRGGNTV